MPRLIAHRTLVSALLTGVLAVMLAGAGCAPLRPQERANEAAQNSARDDSAAQDGARENSASDGAGTVPNPTVEPGSRDPIAPELGEPSPPIERDLDSFPELELDPNGPGSDDAYAKLIAELREHVDEDIDVEPPWPDLRNSDPAEAYRTCSEFQNWIAANDPDPALVSGYAAPNSPEWGWDRDLFSTQRSLGWFTAPANPPYSMSIVDVVNPGASPITDALLAQVPPGSAAVVYYDSVGPAAYVDADGNVVEETDGWADVGPWVAIMEPTEAGWRVWWDELVDPPPGDEWHRGPQARQETVEQV